MTTTDRSRGLLHTEDVARLWTEERRKVEGPNAAEVKVDRVYDFYKWSKPTPTGNKIRNRYEDFPMPYAEATRQPLRAGRRAVQPAWYADQEQDLRDFWHERLAPGEHEETGKRRKQVWVKNFTR